MLASVFYQYLILQMQVAVVLPIAKKFLKNTWWKSYNKKLDRVILKLQMIIWYIDYGGRGFISYYGFDSILLSSNVGRWSSDC